MSLGPRDSLKIELFNNGRTLDGFETHFANNYIGHFLLTRLLLDKLVHSGNDESCSRVIRVSSAHCYSAHEAYARSKLAQVLFTYHLHYELQSSRSDPGLVNTGLYSHRSNLTRLIARLVIKDR
ncbi:dehydrogenase/reductase SDR family member on chromosome X-like [Xyrauchen texanus]|uniref:dehydrogenase/reductase SDR family member on chromosome X-like n=1 Tax=Xyrauchen texanus TaxID=154827 RepID=UPI002242A107|nr:dehydrogenase/reductase SDR family member on chromosome X-like [Xyrauchen texanus]